jgi:hypothetical protein
VITAGGSAIGAGSSAIAAGGSAIAAGGSIGATGNETEPFVRHAINDAAATAITPILARVVTRRIPLLDVYGTGELNGTGEFIGLMTSSEGGLMTASEAGLMAVSEAKSSSDSAASSRRAGTARSGRNRSIASLSGR